MGKVKGMVDQKLRATIITGRTIDQGVGKELGKGSQEYYDNAAVVFLDKADMMKLGIRNGVPVRVTSKFGSVIVKARKFPRGSMPGLVFMPCGLWANAVCGDATYSMGMPMFKGFPVEVEPAPGQPVLTLDELLKEEFGRGL
ncbi:MAG: molybdopterin dinucleotide-binding protein [Candidatus Bathyarchaeota archaeon]|nr:molybdopterin dinucleotide-binding protein [Candidatus Bathyarchaeota archaeon]